MKNFSVGFSRPKKFKLVSWLIMKVMKSTYSHTYLVFSVPATEQQIVCQANKLGVTFLDYKKFKKDNIILEEIAVNPKHRTKALRFCIEHLGNSYSFVTLFAILFNIKFGDGTKQFICSELVARALDLNIKNIDTITPQELMELLETKDGGN